MSYLKLYKNHLIVILLCSIAFIFTFSAFIKKDIEAQTGNSGLFGSFGYACVPNYGDCGGDGTNLLESVTNGGIEVVGDEFDSSEVIGGIKYLWGAGPLCVINNGSKIAPNLTTKIDCENNRGGKFQNFDDLSSNLCVKKGQVQIIPHNDELIDPELELFQKSFGAQTFVASPRICGAGTVAMKVVQGQAGSGANWVSWGCCNPNKALYADNDSKNAVDHQKSIGCCDPGSGNSVKDAKNCTLASASNDIYGFTLGYSTNGSNLRSTNTITPGQNSGSILKCPSEASCAINAGEPVPVFPAKNAGTQCGRCFDTGSPTRFDSTSLYTCKADGTEETVPLINGNVADTLAWLATDKTNQPLLKDCREKGGIYIAIGCVDPSPVGVLTGIIRIAFGVMGGVALIQLIIAGLYYQSGQEDKIKEARSKVIATITGLAVLVFSILILRIIGINILDILPQGSV